MSTWPPQPSTAPRLSHGELRPDLYLVQVHGLLEAVSLSMDVIFSPCPIGLCSLDRVPHSSDSMDVPNAYQTNRVPCTMHECGTVLLLGPGGWTLVEMLESASGKRNGGHS